MKREKFNLKNVINDLFYYPVNAIILNKIQNIKIYRWKKTIVGKFMTVLGKNWFRKIDIRWIMGVWNLWIFDS